MPKKPKSIFNVKIIFKKYRPYVQKKRVLIIALAILALAVYVGLFFYKGNWPLFAKKTPQVSGIILFEGNNCSYCDKVDDFIKSNAIESKVPFTRLEVFDNSFNANLLADKAQVCGLDSSHIGVPFLWDGTTCVVGYVDVITFFREKITKKP
ncbi:MAG: hypothetical protein A2908_00320 [Candidatus Staskawiczbacteria bacterium RIFCSPLOWO2_01_FULL_38_12b]|uniref:Glutaredoxin domain-containing protein n=1 Tax=Candidatus Staskawiczbacteria bacterium RIFCSPLOWO2_01_FULL_38_12b TaxID=1802214 RepID=A0A1G2IEB4_9BACT|nr:MAG: hypothetical protein A2908_00320 [Candidatus Staskawiczbacteria bacterium RIFCSPLOWO2_01_FULL_38_12b]